MIIADYARKYDESTNQCLSGYYAKTLDGLLKDNGYSIDKVYKTCIIKKYYKGLGSGNWKHDKKLLDEFFSETGTSLRYFTDHMVREINELKPALIICLGEFALRALTGKESISKWRGSIIELRDEVEQYMERKNIRVLCSIHPADIQIDESNTFIMRMDFKKGIDYLAKPPLQLDNHDLVIAHNSGDLIRFLDYYPKKKYNRVVSDIETRYGIITCASLSFDGRRGVCVPMYGAPGIDILERCRMMYLLATVLDDPDIGKSNQNIDYDQRIYQRFGFRVAPIIWDTMLAAGIIAPEFPKRLGFLTSIYTDMSYYKDEGRQLDSDIFDYDTYYRYCIKDSISTFQIMDKQIEDLREMDMLDFFVNYIMKCYHMYYDLESIGWNIDIRKRNELAGKYDGLLTLKTLELEALCEKRINPRSPNQIGKYMLECEMPVIYHRTDGGHMVVSTGLDELKKMRSYDPIKYRKTKIPYEHCTRFLSLILLIRRIEKVLEYIEVGLHPWGRIYTNVNVTGTGNGRTSGSKTPDQLWIWVKDKKGEDKLKATNLGQSFQTVTKHGFIIEDEEDIETVGDVIGNDLREMYIPDKDMIIIEADGAQAEARVVDVLAEDWDALAEYGKIDKHCRIASMIYTQYTYEDILRMAKKEKTEEGLFMRQIGKRGKHAHNLGVGPYVLSLTANITQSEAKDILAKLDKAAPKTKEIFHKGVEDHVRATRMLANPFGRKRVFFKKVDNHYIKVWYSWLPQSIISDNTKRAMLKLYDNMDRQKAWFLAENHDSITALVRRGYARTYMAIAKQAMEIPIDMRECSLPRDIQLVIPAEFSISRRSWGELKEAKNLKLQSQMSLLSRHAPGVGLENLM